MPLAKLKQSAHLRLQFVSSPDEFNAIGFLEVERQALLAPYYYGRAITALPGILLMLEQASPRSLTAVMNAMGCTVIVPMDHQTYATFNTQAWSSTEIGLLRGETSFDLRQQNPNTFAVIRFSSDMQNRGWDESEGRLHLSSAGDEHLSRLQHVIREALIFSSTSRPHREFVIAAESLRQELIDALDHVLISGKPRRPKPRTFERHHKLILKLDEFVNLHPEAPLYSDTLAMELGTSVRTLQSAVQEVHGASLHQYLRSKRLWSLRAQLTRGAPLTTVSSVALANGFLHMGELSRLYKSTFGELPSETLLRSKGG